MNHPENEQMALDEKNKSKTLIELKRQTFKPPFLADARLALRGSTLRSVSPPVKPGGKLLNSQQLQSCPLLL